MIPVEGHKNLYRDEKSGAIISTDSHGFSQYKKSKKLKLYVVELMKLVHLNSKTLEPSH